MTPNPSPHPSTSPASWTLEVVRGARVGQSYPLGGGEVVVGNAAAGANGSEFVGLADQEGASPRKMAPHHVALRQVGPDGWVARDLDTPGGTFVNNRRILPGAALAVHDGDVIQLGAVQVRLVHSRPPPAAPPPPPAASFQYRSATSETVCRSWDDFLTLSAQRWDELRDDLAAGKIAAFVESIGRPDLAPAPVRTSLTTELADERLDAWLDRLPTRSPAAPELDVHPLRIAIAVPAGGVTVARKVRVANVGYRLLRAQVTIEAASGATFTLGAGFADREIIIRDSVDVPFEVAVPDPFLTPAAAQLVIRGAGAEKRVAIRVEPKVTAAATEPGDSAGAAGGVAIPGPVALFLSLPLGKRVAIAALGALAVRLLVGVAGGSIGEDAMVASGPDAPGLGGVVVAFGLTFAGLVGGVFARRGGRGDGLSGAIAGAGLGVLVGTASVALCRAVEPALGSLAASPLVVIGLWAAIGAGLAFLIPGRTPEPTQEPTR